MAGYLNSIANSLIKKTVPSVANSVFPNEHQKVAAFSDKWESATAIMNKAKADVVSTAGGMGGPGALGKKLASQLKSGKFGTTTQEAEDQMFKSMGFDFGDDSSDFGGGDSTSSGEDSGGNTINKKNVFNIHGPLGNNGELTKGDALLNERLAINNQAQMNISHRQISLLANIGLVLSNISDFMNVNMASHIESSMSHYQLQASMNDKFNEAMEPMVTYFKEANEERRAKKSAKDLGAAGGGDIGNVLDPEYYAKKMTEGSFSLLFGDMSPIKGMLEGFSNDPLGTLVAAGVGSAVTSIFSSQVDKVKGLTETLEYKMQNTLEDWSKSADTGMLGTLKNAIGNQFKTDRDTAAGVKVGKYNEGEIGFDGQTKKAIVDVIPMYLSKILKAVSEGATDHEVYDYKKGAFISGHQGRRELSKKLANIDRGNFSGGVGQEMKFSMFGSGLDPKQQKQLQRMIVNKALDDKASQGHIKDLDLGDADAQANFNKVLGNLSPKELRELNTSFAGYRFEREKHVRKLQGEMGSSGMEQAAILGGSKHYGLRAERTTVVPPIPPVPGPGGGPGPNPPPGGGPDDSRGPFDDLADELERARKERERNRNGGNPPGPGGILDSIKDKLGRATDKFTTLVDDKLFSPLRHALMGKKEHSKEDAKDASFLDSIGKGWNRLIIRPFKTALLGVDKKKVDDISFYDAMKNKFDVSILTPLKKGLVGEERAEGKSFMDVVKLSFNEKIMDPIKGFMLGKDAKPEDIQNTGFFKSIGLGLDRTIFMPVKKLLVGDKKAEGMTIFGALNKSFSKNIVFPMKKALLGDDADTKTIAKTSFMKSLGLRLDHSVLLPLKTALMGGKRKKAEEMTIWSTLGNRFERSVLFPMKKMLMGGEDRSTGKIFRTSFFNALKTGWTEKIMQPLSGMLFGKDKSKNGFFKNIGETFSPFFNKLLFGADKASKGGLLANIKTESKALWENIWGGVKDKFFKPMTDGIKELFGPVFKEFKGVIGENLKDFGRSVKDSISGGIKVGAKGLFKDVFGDETVKLLRDNVVKPLKDVTDKLTENMSKVFKFLFRIPVNFMKGITDSLKLQRLNSGKGNYSADEVKRLKDIEKNGKVFDFLNLGAANGAADDKKKGNSLFSRFASALTGKNVESVSGSGTIKLGRDKNAAKDNGIDAHAATRSAGKANSKVSGADIRSEANHAAKAGQKNPNDHALNDYVNGNNRIGGGAGGSSANDSKLAPRAGGLGGSSHSLASPATSLATIATTSRLMDAAIPTLIKGASDNSKILEFMRKNMTKVDLRLENVVKLLRKGVGADVTNVKGSDKFSLFRNPLHWIADKVGGVFSFASNLLSNVVGSVAKVVSSVASIPGKIIGSLTKVVTTMANSMLKVTGTVINAAGHAITKGVEIAGRLSMSLLNGMSKVVSGLWDATSKIVAGTLQFVGSIAGPLAKGIGQVTVTIAKSLVPVAQTLVSAIGTVTKGLINLGAAAVNTGLAITKSLFNVVARGLGFNGVGGKGGKGVRSGKSDVSISNYFELATQSKINPMHVHVVDGKIATYAYQKRELRKTLFNDNDESRSLLGGKKGKDGEDKKKGGLMDTLSGLFGGLGNIKGLGMLGKAIGSLGGLGGLGGALGGLKRKKKAGLDLPDANDIPDVDIDRDGKKKPGSRGEDRHRGRGNGRRGGRKASRRLPTRANTNTPRPSVTPRTVPNPATIAENAGNAGRAARVASTAGTVGEVAGGAAKKGWGSRLMGATKNLFGGGAATTGGKMANFGGKLLKGAGIGSAIGMGGNFAADLFFDEGSFGHDLVGDTATYAGYGALAGSIIPGLGTAVGAALGGLFGAVKVLSNRFVGWFEEKFQEEIKNATETFIQIPNKITQWADSLPDRISSALEDLPAKMSDFLNGIPKFVSEMFMSDATTVNEKGEVVEPKPSILGRMFSAMGQAVWAIIKAVPKIVLSLVEGLSKALMGAAVGGVTLVAKGLFAGITGVGDLLGKMFDKTVIKAQNYLPTVLGGTSDEEAAAALKEVDIKYEKRAMERTSALASITETGNMASNFLTGSSVADGISAGGESGINEYRNMYNDVQAQSKGDDAKALALFKEKTAGSLDPEAALKEFMSQKSEKSNRDQGLSSNTTGTIGVGGYSINKGAVASNVTATKHTSDPGTFTSEDVDKAIKLASDKYGIPVSALQAIAQIESNKRYWVTNKAGYSGLYQMGRDEFAQFSPDPSGSPLDPYLNAMAGANYMAFNAAGLKAAGIPTTAENIYLAHQQGLGGISSIYAAAKGEKALGASTIRNMKSNPPQDGAGATDDPRSFIDRWSAVMAKKTGEPSSGNGLSMLASSTQNAGAGKAPNALTAQNSAANDPALAAMADKYLNGNMANIHAMMGGYDPNKSNKPKVSTVVPMANGGIPAQAANSPSVGSGAMLPEASADMASPSVQVTAQTSVNNATQLAADNARLAAANNPIPEPVAPVAPVESPTAVLARELSKQTALLAQIATNTGKSNFFTGGTPAQAPASSTQTPAVNANLTLNQHKSLIQQDQGPLMLQPGNGARNIAKAGTN